MKNKQELVIKLLTTSQKHIIELTISYCDFKVSAMGPVIIFEENNSLVMKAMWIRLTFFVKVVPFAYLI